MNKKPGAKKRGRKPKGGKIVSENVSTISISTKPENIILHLSCKLSDLSSKLTNYTPYNTDTKYSLFSETSKKKSTNTIVKQEEPILYDKIIELQQNLHSNYTKKNSACFCCTCKFDTPTIYIPKQKIKDKWAVYGHFCSPECAANYLFKEKLSTTILSERYSLLNLLYSEIYKYKHNIIPAPDPHYMLDKFYGNLSIVEYRRLLRNKRFIYITNKPLTNILPELHFDHTSDKNIEHSPTNTNIVIKKKTKKTKNDLLSNNFNLHSY
jgi:hypothetical protein